MSDEYIRKDVALDALKAQADTMWTWVLYAEQRRGILTAVNIIEDVEPADVIPVVHAYWIDTDNYYRRWKCSACSGHTKEAHPLFCLFCGAKMDGKERK